MLIGYVFILAVSDVIPLGKLPMLVKTRTCALVGLNGVLIESEVNIATGLPAFYFVGLADLSDSPDIFMDHEAEALQYRPKITA
tara:strand:+ start:197 stop:448 length:252 start_codon:yes stop_codon:yes gene_type:complete